MKLQTPVSIPTSPTPLGLQSPLVLLGSCFAQHLSAKLRLFKFCAGQADLGAIFNPISILKALRWALGEEEWEEERLLACTEGVYRHYFMHSKYWGESPEELYSELRVLRKQLHSELSQAQLTVILTLGTAWVHEHSATGAIVANCHKQPSSQFTKRLLSLSQVTEALEGIRSLLPDARFIVTVSPVRHIKETLALNSASKSLLRVACHEFQHHPNVSYFPSYEILLDELRDYRFYKEDLIHPSGQAVEYVWQRFVSTQLSSPAQQWVAKWDKVQKSLKHKPFTPCTHSHLSFLKDLEKTLRGIAEANVQDEINRVQAQIELCQQRWP